MPCRVDHFDSYLEIENQRKINELEAMLCAVLSVLASEGHLFATLNKINEEESGIRCAALREWWKNHQEKDRDRREKEKQEKELAQKKFFALNKLTEEEKKILGLAEI